MGCIYPHRPVINQEPQKQSDFRATSTAMLSGLSISVMISPSSSSRPLPKTRMSLLFHAPGLADCPEPGNLRRAFGQPSHACQPRVFGDRVTPLVIAGRVRGW
jgi:hypothetical protein